jgi:hypothetical protein
VQKFACWTKATLAEEWAENVTHVIVGKGAGRSWCRSFEVLMAILLGKWVVRFECQYLKPWIISTCMSRAITFCFVLSLRFSPGAEPCSFRGRGLLAADSRSRGLL